jgi:uncharacterized SAM-binding protein YcdF (DUF218 family)
MVSEVISSKMNGKTLQSRLQEILSGGKAGESSRGTGGGGPSYVREHGDTGEGRSYPESKPIEPEGARVSGIARLKWVFFVLALLYVLISAYHGLVLMSMGRYLVVAHPPEKSDLIVCLGGGNVERGLAAADAYRRGLAPHVFVAREIIPDGYDILKQRGVSYPESRDLMILMLKELGVPESAILTRDTPSESTVMEAGLVRKLVREKNYRSLILVTSPTHSRRAFLAFKKAMAGDEVSILVIPSSYSKYDPEAWWKNPKQLREVLLEYQKLVYYFFKGYL